jgi:carbon-monoxide dehydrogenase medium subunit
LEQVALVPKKLTPGSTRAAVVVPHFEDLLMKPAPFTYFAPETTDDALAALREHGFTAKLLAGGQSLVPVMNFRLAQPGVLIDLNRITALDYIRRETDGLHIGSMVRVARLEHDPHVAAELPLVHEALPHIAHPQIRNRGTVGGSLAHADPAAELPVLTVALNGRFRLQKIGGERWLTAVDFFTGLFETALADEEILTEIVLPFHPPGTGTAFLEVARRHGDYALAGVAVVVTLDDAGVCRAARLVYLNAGVIPVVATSAAAQLIGRSWSEDAAQAAAEAAQKEIDPQGDIHASTDFKRHLAKVLTVRALKLAFARAAGEGGRAI